MKLLFKDRLFPLTFSIEASCRLVEFGSSRQCYRRHMVEYLTDYNFFLRFQRNCFYTYILKTPNLVGLTSFFPPIAAINPNPKTFLV